MIDSAEEVFGDLLEARVPDSTKKIAAAGRLLARLEEVLGKFEYRMQKKPQRLGIGSINPDRHIPMEVAHDDDGNFYLSFGNESSLLPVQYKRHPGEYVGTSKVRVNGVEEWSDALSDIAKAIRDALRKRAAERDEE